VVEHLKNLALSHQVPVVAVVAADKEGLQAGRIRLHHLRGEAALAYECDIAVMMNPEPPATPGEPAPGGAGGDPDRIGFTIEKNRTGPTAVEVFYRRQGAQFRFDPA
jgi:replicative DNA helicase